MLNYLHKHDQKMQMLHTGYETHKYFEKHWRDVSLSNVSFS